MADENVELLKKAIQNVLADRENDKDELQCKIISGQNSDLIDISNVLHMFETSIVENLIREIANIKKEPNYTIGWEMPYPKAHKGWARSKCDLALDCINPDCVKPENNEECLFKTIIEVKRVYVPEKDFNEVWEPYNVWGDIFKIIGYFDDKKQDAGQNKFVLLFFPYYRSLHLQEYSERLEKIFSQKEQFGKQTLAHKKFLKEKLNWKDEDIKTIWNRPEIQNDKVTIRFEPFDVGMEQKYVIKGKKKVAAVLMRIGLQKD